MEKEELTQLFNFFREIDKEKFIGRQTYLTDGVRKENDAEHAWHMAIMTVLLAGYADEKIDVLNTVLMVELVYLQFYNNMTFQNTVIEHKVGKEIIFINQDAFLPGFKAEAMSHF